MRRSGTSLPGAGAPPDWLLAFAAAWPPPGALASSPGLWGSEVEQLWHASRVLRSLRRTNSNAATPAVLSPVGQWFQESEVCRPNMLPLKLQ
eukprot:3494630-Alexandrium_andersonii.AAC.1